MICMAEKPLFTKHFLFSPSHELPLLSFDALDLYPFLLRIMYKLQSCGKLWSLISLRGFYIYVHNSSIFSLINLYSVTLIVRPATEPRSIEGRFLIPHNITWPIDHLRPAYNLIEYGNQNREGDFPVMFSPDRYDMIQLYSI